MPIGSIIDRARKDTLAILQGAFSIELTLEPNYTNVIFVDGLEENYVDGDGALYTSTILTDSNSVTIQGLATRHRQAYDPDTGLPIIGKQNHCSFSEVGLNGLGYATRDTNGDCTVKGWLVSWTDAIGLRKYKIEEIEPDETVGLIKCSLGDYATN